MRRPQHRWQVRHRPWQIQPICIAPVLPGETLKNILFQSRAVTDPIKSKLIGWWLEYYFFYCKHRDLDARDTMVNMALETSETLASLNEAASFQYFHYASHPNFVKLCLKRIVEEYFRVEGEAWDVALLPVTTGLPMAAIDDMSWMDSMVPSASMPDTDIDMTGTDTVDIDAAMNAWEYMRAMNLTQMSYEDYLSTFGVRGAQRLEPHKPELLRYVRNWTYPSNTIDPTSGAASSACSWSISERADKDRFFTEPGWVIGCTIARPKVYLRKQEGSMADGLNSALNWLPAIMRDDPWTSLKKFADNTGPVGTVNTDAGGYWVDLRDLLLYGDQFWNFDPALVTDGSFVDLPTAALQRRYAVSADADGLFVSAAPANQVRQDGIAHLSILGTQVDQTVTSIG